jgi:ribose 5-phosphate isomerase RpiB
MPIIIASDIPGIYVKNYIKEIMTENGCDIIDIGTVNEYNISKIGQLIQNYPNWIGIVFCNNVNCCSLQLNSMYTNVRCITAQKDPHDLYMARKNYKANIMCFPSTSHKSDIMNLISGFICV